MVHIREYKSTDFDQIVELGRDFQSFLVKLDAAGLTKELNEDEAKKYAELSIKDVKEKEGIYLVAEDNGKLVGLCCGIIDRKSNKYAQLMYEPEIQGWIGELYVVEAYRGTGLGKRLVLGIEKYFQSKGCTSCWLKVASYNRNAIGFYDALGFDPREIEMRKSLKKK
jgi:ribosomal protein S18 acetylase RimI-like enzyme